MNAPPGWDFQRHLIPSISAGGDQHGCHPRPLRVRAQSLSPTACHPMDRSPPGSSVHGVLQARILEQLAISFSWGSSRPRDGTRVSCVSCMAGRFLTTAPPRVGASNGRRGLPETQETHLSESLLTDLHLWTSVSSSEKGPQGGAGGVCRASIPAVSSEAQIMNLTFQAQVQPPEMSGGKSH